MDNSENTTESPEVVSEDEGKSADIGLMALATDYPATTGVMGLKMDSINQHTGQYTPGCIKITAPMIHTLQLFLLDTNLSTR